MRNYNEQITLEKWQLSRLLEKISHISNLLTALNKLDFSKLEQYEIESVILSVLNLNEANYSDLNRLLGGEE